MIESDPIAAKQAYLRNNIPADKYEDFAQFCENVASSIDIEGWSAEYVIGLVEKFKKMEAEKAKNNKKTGAFHLYQTGSDDELNDVARKIKKEAAQQKRQNLQNQQKRQSPKQQLKLELTSKVKQQKSALDVLDSIFKNAPPAEQTKKYDKAFFESCNFWGVPAEQPAKEKQRKTPTKNKDSPKFMSNSLPVQADNFDKMFRTGLGIDQVKAPSKDKTPKKQEKPVFVEIPIDDDLPKKAESSPNAKPPQMTGSKKSQIKLVSVKDLKSPKKSKASSGGKIPYDGEALIKEPFKDRVACFKSFERAALASKELKVEIRQHQIIGRSFFSSDYPMFHLRVLPSSVVCKRNLQDFQKLRRSLESVYPGMRLPYLQKLGWLESETSPQYIQRQKKYLTYFLEDILQSEELKNSRILEDFLTLKDHKQIKRKFQEYDKIRKIIGMEELCLLQGEVKVQLTEHNRQYNQLFQGFLEKLKAFWEQEEQILVQVCELHARLADSYRELKHLIDDMGQETHSFNKRVRFNEAQHLVESLRSLSEYVGENMRVNEREAALLQDQVMVYLRFEKGNMGMFEGVAAARNDLTRSYLRRRDAERSNDNVEYLSQRLKESKVGVLEESSSITVLKYQCGYINTLMADEALRYLNHLSHKMEEMVSSISYCKLDHLAQSINTFTALVQA